MTDDSNKPRFTLKLEGTGSTNLTDRDVYLIRETDGLRQVTFEECQAAFNAGQPVFWAPIDGPAALPAETRTLAELGWEEIGYASDIPEAFRRES